MRHQTISYCPGDLSPVQNGTYSRAFRKEMFEGAKVNHILDYSSPGNYLSEVEDITLAMGLSISGVQIKFSVKQDGKKLIKTSSKGEFILKPIPTGVVRAEEVPANEHLTMQLARQVYGIETAVNGLVFYGDGEPAYITRRFDRRPDGAKFRQEDFAQLIERTEQTHGLNYKYDFSYEDAGRLMWKFIPAWMPQLERFYCLVLFNYLFSNGDAHLKNFSLTETVDGDYILSPAYDLLCSRIHSPQESDMASTGGLFIDHETPSFEANGFYAYDDFHEFGLRLGLIPKRVERFLSFFQQHHPKVDQLIKRSYLSKPVKEEYRTYFKDRLKRLNYSFAGKQSG